MTVKYKVVSTVKPGSNDKTDLIHFPKLCNSKKADSRHISKLLSMRSSASRSDVAMIIEGLATLIPELLANGYTVKLDNFGIFRLHAKAEPSNDPEKVTAHNIKGYRISFIPDKEIKSELKVIKAKKA